MNDNVITYILSSMCLIVILIEWMSFNYKKGKINAIVFVIYSIFLYYLMFYKGSGGAGFTWWFYLLLLTSLHIIILLFGIAKSLFRKLIKRNNHWWMYRIVTDRHRDNSVGERKLRRTEVNHPASDITTFTYDALGNVLTKPTLPRKASPSWTMAIPTMP